MTVGEYLDLKAAIVGRGYAEEIRWAETVAPPITAEDFASEAIWVVLNAGMREQVARVIQGRILPHLYAGRSASEGFGHKLKCRAIDHIYKHRAFLFERFNVAADKLAFLEGLPHIGPITKYHLARNLGMDVCKPDRHLVRIAGAETPHQMCERLSKATGDRIGVVDCVIWRAANLGLV